MNNDHEPTPQPLTVPTVSTKLDNVVLWWPLSSKDEYVIDARGWNVCQAANRETAVELARLANLSHGLQELFESRRFASLHFAHTFACSIANGICNCGAIDSTNRLEALRLKFRVEEVETFRGRAPAEPAQPMAARINQEPERATEPNRAPGDEEVEILAEAIFIEAIGTRPSILAGIGRLVLTRGTAMAPNYTEKQLRQDEEDLRLKLLGARFAAQVLVAARKK